MPDARIVAKTYKQLALSEISKLFASPIHEHRLTAAMILTYKFNKANSQDLYDFYIDHVLHHTTLQVAPKFIAKPPRTGIDNWDIVDTSAHKILGRYLSDKQDREILYKLADHEGLWQNRVAMMSTWWFINKHQDYSDCFALAEQFISHPHDLMHKVTGWMLREVGKQDQAPLLAFLDQYSKEMPRTMLRYAIERLPDHTRRHYLDK